MRGRVLRSVYFETPLYLRQWLPEVSDAFSDAFSDGFGFPLNLGPGSSLKR